MFSTLFVTVVLLASKLAGTAATNLQPQQGTFAVDTCPSTAQPSLGVCGYDLPVLAKGNRSCHSTRRSDFTGTFELWHVHLRTCGSCGPSVSAVLKHCNYKCSRTLSQVGPWSQG
jgi:hypothetical protein